MRYLTLAPPSLPTCACCPSQVRALQVAISGLEVQLAQAVSERDALVSEKEALVSQHGDLEAARAEREERLRVLEGVLQQVSWGIRWVGAGGIKISKRGRQRVEQGVVKWERVV